MEQGKSVIWVGDSLRRLRAFPDDVRDEIGFALYHAQLGQKHASAKPMKGHKGAGVLEIVEDFDGDTYRAVYTVKFSDAVYVLHAFQKKSNTGIKTPKEELEVVVERLKSLENEIKASRR